MYLYENPVSFHGSQNLRLPGTLSRFGEPPAPAPDLVLDDFDFDRSILKPSHKNQIDKLAQQIVDSWKPASTRQALSVRAVGHTDKVGPVEYNLDLGRLRAEKVMGRLTGLIIGGDIDTYQRMTWSLTSEGKARPRSVSVPAQNRRVEIFIQWGRVKPPPPPPKPKDPRCVAACNTEESRCLDHTRFPPECQARRADCVRGCR
jgi:OmpA family protein